MPQRRRTRDRRRARPQAAPTPQTHRLAIAVGAALVVASFALYLATAARDIVFGDTPELTTAALTLGVAHPPGYPLFTILGWLFGQMPTGPLPFRVALLSVVCHAATVGVVYAATYRFARSVPAAAVAAAALASEPLFWSWSLVAEVFPLNDLLSATMLLLVALWHEHPERSGLLIAGAFVGGLGMTDHQTIALLAPAVLYVMWRRRDVLLSGPGLVLRAAAAFVIGLVPYLELLVAASRHPAWSWGDLQTPGELVSHVLRLRYGSTALVNEPTFIGGSALDRVVAIFTSLDPLQWSLLSVGAVYALWARRWYATYLLVAFAFAGPAFAAYSNINLSNDATRPLVLAVLQRFFLMPHTVIAPLAGFAVLAASDLAGRLGAPGRRAEMGAAALACLAAVALVPLEYRGVDRSDDHLARRYGGDLLATMKPNGIFLVGGDAALFPSVYLRVVEQGRPDVTLVALPLVPEEWYVRELRRADPTLVLPHDRYGRGGPPLRALIDANRSRPIAVLGVAPDPSAGEAYWMYSRGLTFELRPLDQGIPVDDMAAENEGILAGYHPAPYAAVTGPYRVWERLVLGDYARAYYRVGHEYEVAADPSGTGLGRSQQLTERAKSWYRRALEIDPDLAEARVALERLSR